MVWLQVVAVTAVAVLLVLGVAHLPAVLEAVALTARRLRRRREQPPPAPRLDHLAADLHRLARQLGEVERSDAPAKAARLRATAIAYDDVLLRACRTLEIESPGHTPLDPLERLETEAALAQQGLVW